MYKESYFEQHRSFNPTHNDTLIHFSVAVLLVSFTCFFFEMSEVSWKFMYKAVVYYVDKIHKMSF